MYAARSLSNAKSNFQNCLLGHPGNPVGLIVTSLDPGSLKRDIGIIASVDFRMPFPSEDPGDTSLFKVLFDKKYIDVSRIELESKFHVHDVRISLPPEGIELKPNPSEDVLRNLSRLMGLVHKYDYLISSQSYKQ